MCLAAVDLGVGSRLRTSGDSSHKTAMAGSDSLGVPLLSQEDEETGGVGVVAHQVSNLIFHL